jgi:hypothetical protein
VSRPEPEPIGRPDGAWGPRRFAALGLALLIAGLLAVALARGVRDPRVLGSLVMGVVVGGLYCCRGALPARFYEDRGTVLDALRPNLRREDEPGNISPRVYLPILLVLILLGIAAFAIVPSL